MQRIGHLAGLVLLLLISGCGQSDIDEPVASSKDIILVTGATGTQGGAVARELLKRGIPVRALTRNPGSESAQALADAGAEVVRGDFEDPDSLQAAMQGAHGVFAITDFWEHGYAGEVRHGDALIAAAETAGVAHFVYTSASGVDGDTGIAHFDSKLEIEDMLTESDLAYTILRPVGFMDNWRYSIDEYRSGVYRSPRDATDQHQWIAASDIGFFAAEAFEHPEDWLGRTVDIAGDELSLAELVAVMSDVFGRPVVYEQISWDEYDASVNEDIAAMNHWFAEDGYDVNIESLRSRYPNLLSVREYLTALAAK